MEMFHQRKLKTKRQNFQASVNRSHLQNRKVKNFRFSPLRAKSEALDNTCSLFKQNIKLRNAMRWRQRRRTVKNNNIGLISKKATLHVQHTFLYTSLPLFCTNTTWNVQKLPSYKFYGGNAVRVLVHFPFLLPLIFTLVAANISHFLTATFHVVIIIITLAA